MIKSQSKGRSTLLSVDRSVSEKWKISPQLMNSLAVVK